MRDFKVGDRVRINGRNSQVEELSVIAGENCFRDSFFNISWYQPSEIEKQGGFPEDSFQLIEETKTEIDNSSHLTRFQKILKCT